jgi:surfeit locus 1 family protein
MYRFLLTRRWLVLESLLVVLVVGFLSAGVWQLGRLDEKKRLSRSQLARSAQPEASVADALAQRPEAAVYRRVAVTGTYDVEHEVVLLSRSFDGISGHHLLTPLVDAGRRAVIVDRGWVPLDDGHPGAPDALPPPGVVTVRGVLLASQHRGIFGPRLPLSGYLDEMFRIDVPRLRKQLPYAVYDDYLLLASQEPAQARALPKVVALPAPDLGPHLNYAIQWFSFAAIALLTFSALARRTSRTVRAGAVEPDAAPADVAPERAEAPR